MIRPNGLRPYIPSALEKKKDYSFHRTFGAAMLTGLPDNYNADNSFGFPYQGDTTECTGYTVTDICADEDGRQYSHDYNYAKTLQIMNAPATFQGADLKTAFSVPVTKFFGLLPANLAPITWEKNGQTYAADYKNWPESLDVEARKNLKDAYFMIDGPYDCFDNIRSVIWAHRLERRTVGVGTPWYFEYETVGPSGILPQGKVQGSWHAHKICGWKTLNSIEYLISKSWQGPAFGDNGYVYFSRDEFNHIMSISGSIGITIGKVDPNDVQTVKLSLREQLLALFQLIRSFFSLN